MPRHLFISFAVMVGLPGLLYGQLGGDNTYEFLNLPWSVRGSVLGGTVVSLKENDPLLLLCNPALTGNQDKGLLAVSYASYLAGIDFGSALYTFGNKKGTSLSAGINWLNYGTFTGADDDGTINGSFRAAEYAIHLACSRSFDTIFSAGVAVKPVISQLESYTSIGLALDFGASVTSRDSSLTAGLTLKNIGLQITTYSGHRREALPFEIQAGVSKKLKHAPFRFSLTLRNLQKLNIAHNKPTPGYYQQPDNSGVNNRLATNLLGHALFGVECLPHRNFWLGAGYNYLRRNELRIDTGGAGVGLSWGFGINISGFRFAFSRASYHLAGGTNQFALTLNPGSLYRRISN